MIRRLALCLSLALAACINGGDGGAAVPAPAAVGPAGPLPPDRILGLDEVGLLELLGPADLARTEADIRILQFEAAGCVADVYLYPQPGEGRRATYAEARTADGRATDAAACFGAVAAGR